MGQFLKSINQSYENLIPNKKEGLIIFWLNEKIRKGEIDKNFTYQNIRQAIQAAATFDPGPQSQPERILKNLLHYFIERPPNKPSRYKLTEYAVKFIKLIENKLNNPYRNFPLRETFKQFADFKAIDMKDIDSFESWFEQGFNSTTRQTIIDHLEALKDEVARSIGELNQILRSDKESALEMALKFSVIFKTLGDRADEIRDTLKLGTELDHEIQEVVNSFYDKVERFRHPQNVKEYEEYRLLEAQYQRTNEIQKDVSSFFEVIDEKLGQLRAQILFASIKLAELPEHFKYQSRFKVKLRNLLQFILQESEYSKEGPITPAIFPRKFIPFETLKFIGIAYYESFLPSQNKIIPLTRDDKYEKYEREKIKSELQRQESTVRWVKKYKEILRSQRKLDFTKHFYRILEIENDIEIPLQVAFELFQFANDSPEYSIQIDKTLIKEFKQKQVVTWKMNIQHTN